MININVRENYTVDTISKTNDIAWKKLVELLVENEDYLFDFKGIELVDPWLNDEFRQFMADDRVNIQLYSSKKTAYTINTMCVLAGYKGGRASNIDIVAPKKLSMEEKIAISTAKGLQSYFVTDDNESTTNFNVYSRYDQLGSVTTIEHIEAAIRLFNESKSGYGITLDLGKIFVQDNIIELISDTIDRLLGDGILVNVVSSDKDVNSKIGIHRHMSKTKDYEVSDRESSFRNIKPGTVGMLSRYKESRGVDEFGRMGKGLVVSCRPAIFRGMTSSSDGVESRPIFDVYNGDGFYTKQHWMLENDSMELDELSYTEIRPEMEEVGLYGDFLGSKYHFMRPIQYDEFGYTTMYNLDDYGVVKTTMATIPERIKSVLDDWEVSYNSNLLIDCIEETNKVLNK